MDDQVFVIHRKLVDELDKDHWVPQWRCESVPVAELLGASAGILLATIIIATIATVVIINLNDLREWKRYEAMRLESEQRLGEFMNPLYEGNTTSTTNPMCDLQTS